ncbi:hypothetical protein BCR42DRAFT_81306 [Absidia repens]|uniref:Uncharacterized protein n=1 Tax=Absidia repens TaxID=90262 RepID=A0A1X2I9P3_9FUNG|nr:hypothetical protein BCR42DRAFT_81306 [Absidia repens]
MDIDDYLNLQSHSDGSIHELQDIVSPTHITNPSAPRGGTGISTMDVAKTMASSNITATATETENEHASSSANYPIFSTTTPTCWTEQMNLTTHENDTTRLFDKSLPDVDQFLYTFGGGNSHIPATSNWNILAQHQNHHTLSMTPTPLPDLANMPACLPDFLAPHFLTLADMDTTGDNNLATENGGSMVQQANTQSSPAVIDTPVSEALSMVTRSKRQKTIADATTTTTTTTKHHIQIQ